jgi:type IV pilus assembly protein PilY1
MLFVTIGNGGLSLARLLYTCKYLRKYNSAGEKMTLSSHDCQASFRNHTGSAPSIDVAVPVCENGIPVNPTRRFLQYPGMRKERLARCRSVARKQNAREGKARCDKARFLSWALPLFLAFHANAASLNAPFDISNVPLMAGGALSPNLMVLVDNSGAMHWHHSPANAERYQQGDPCCTNPLASNLPYRSSHINRIYYDPMVKYRPPLRANGASFPDMPFTAAKQDGFGAEYPNPHKTHNLATSFRDSWYINLEHFTRAPAMPAYYNRYNEKRPGCVHVKNGKDYYYLGYGSGLSWDEIQKYYKCFDTIIVGSYQDKDEYNHPDNRGSAQKKRQNFANWFSYYRVRINQVKSVLSHVMQNVSGDMRVGFGATGANGGPNFYWGTYKDPVICSGNGYSVRENGQHCSAYTASRDGSVAVYAISRGVRPFRDFPNDADIEPKEYRNQKYKSEFYKWLFAINTIRDGNTEAAYLRRALDAAGLYFQTSSGTGGAWSVSPGVPGSPVQACRKSYTLLVSVGQYRHDVTSSWSHQNLAIRGVNVDGMPGLPIRGENGEFFQYVPQLPFMDNATDTLADIAMHYWKNDLLPQQPNNVPVNAADPAFWQHMNVLALSIGSQVDIDKETVFRAMYNPKALPPGWGYNGTNSWGNAPRDGQREGNPRSFLYPDDMLHAALNSRGGFYDTSNPDELTDVLTRALDAVKTDNLTFAPTATNSGSPQHPMLYQAIFNSSDWSSKLLGYKLCTGLDVARDYDPKNPGKAKNADSACLAEGNLWAKPQWDAGERLAREVTDGSHRNIATWNGKRGVNFAWSDLTAQQQAALDNDPHLLKYLRGDRSREKSVDNNGVEKGSYRARNNKLLGDIVNSAPLYVGNDDFGFANAGGLSLGERNRYRARKNRNARRQEMLYVGANDGMFHAFNANTGDAPYQDGGKEVFAYVPNHVIPRLKELSRSGYTHGFYVDGSTAVGDAIVDGDWKTVLVGSTGAGGAAYFALDVEDPSTFSSRNVLWEISSEDKDFENLGIAMGQAAIAKVGNDWAAIFGNGYNSAGHTARLFVVDLATGDRIAEINTRAGDAQHPNGLSAPLVADVNQDGVADVAYAGDLLGNLWKFNLKSLPRGATTGGEKLLEAKSGDSPAKIQPITARPEVVKHPLGGLMVYVGTGKFFEPGDRGDKSLQSFYGVRDKCGAEPHCATTSALSRDDLLAQTVETQEKRAYGNMLEAVETRVVSDHKPKDPASFNGFYIDLALNAGGKQNRRGERVISTPIAWRDRVIFNTIEPSDDACAPTGDGWMWEIDPFSGGRTAFSAFDLNNDGIYGGKHDFSKAGKVVSARKVGMGGGVMARGANKYLGNTKGRIEKVSNNPKTLDIGRKSWRQIR